MSRTDKSQREKTRAGGKAKAILCLNKLFVSDTDEVAIALSGCLCVCLCKNLYGCVCVCVCKYLSAFTYLHIGPSSE